MPALYRIHKNLDARILDLDNLSTLADHNWLLTLSQKCIDKQVEYNARQRTIYERLDEIDALETHIMVNHASELGDSRPLTDLFEAERKLVSDLRMGCLKTCWREIS